MRIALLISLLAACDAAAELVDAPDAPAARDADTGALDGAWLLAWQCEDGCLDGNGHPYPPPGVACAIDLTVRDATLHWYADRNCDVREAGARIDAHCIVMTATTDGSIQRDAFDLCQSGAVALATITWWPAGRVTPSTRWTARGTRR